MGDPLTPNKPEETPVENTNTIPEVKPIEIDEPSVANVAQPVPEVDNILPPVQPVPILVQPTVEPITPTQSSVPLPEVTPPQALTKVEEPTITKVNVSKTKKRVLLVLLALLFLIVAIVISVFLIQSNKPPVENNNPLSAPVENVVSLPSGFVLKNFEGRLYNVSFQYTSELGTASDTTSKVTYPSAPEVNGDCNIENITFSSDRDLSIGISTGHCEGGGTIPNEYSKVTSKDGKSFFIVVKKLDETLFPGMYTISASLGDSEGNFSPAITGVHIDAIRVKNLEKYKKYIEDIISTLTVELSPLKSENFDTKSNI